MTDYTKKKPMLKVADGKNDVEQKKMDIAKFIAQRQQAYNESICVALCGNPAFEKEIRDGSFVDIAKGAAEAMVKGLLINPVAEKIDGGKKGE